MFVKANIVRDEKFEDLEELSEKNRQQLREKEMNYGRSSDFIPGLPPIIEAEGKSALDD